MQATYSGLDKRLQYLFQNAKSVSVTQTLAQGTKIGDITIDGVTTDLYAPDGGGGGSTVTCTPLVDEGTAIALFTIGQNTYTIYSPVTTEVTYTDLIGDEIDVDDGQQAPVVAYNQATYKIGNLVIANGDDYRLSPDTDVVSGKTYYERTDNYVPVTPSAGANPNANGWYEYNGSTYVRTQDTTVQSGKTYYKLVPSYSPVTPSAGDNPSTEGWYELATTPIPIYAPPATAVQYDSNYNAGVHVGTLRVSSISNDPNHEDDPSIVDTDTFEIIIPQGSAGGSIVSYVQLVQSGTKIGTITIDGVPTDIYAPSGGSGDVSDVKVNGSSVVDANHVAQIDLTGYATDSELSSAVATLQANFQDGVDRIYEACVRKGSTPVSHSLADVINAIYAIGGQMEYRDVESTLSMNMRYFGHAKEDE